MKTCKRCRTSKELTDFSRNKGSKSGVNSVCKDCKNSYAASYRVLNKDTVYKKIRELWKLNKEEYNYCKSIYYNKNKSKWRGYNAKRRAALRNATPNWADVEAIQEFYNNCPDGYHVDHIYPLTSEFCCGLHVLGNLQYLTAFENMSKSNKVEGF